MMVPVRSTLISFFPLAFVSFAIAFGAVLWFVPRVRAFALKIRAVQHGGGAHGQGQRQHRGAVPNIGGIAILGGFLLAVLVGSLVAPDAIDEYRVTGGGARSDAWLQIKADILGRPLTRPKITEAGALGAAILAGVGGGVYRSAGEAIEALVKIDRVFEPDARRHELYDQRFARYHPLYPFARSLSGAAE